MRLSLLSMLLLITISFVQCTRTAFAPIWYSVNPIAPLDVRQKGDLLASYQYFDADNGGGIGTTAVYSPAHHLMLGGGIGTLGNKGEIYLDSAYQANSRQWQADLFGGGYFSTKNNLLSLQFITGFAYSNSRSYIRNKQQLALSYQKLYLQPAAIVKLPNHMSFSFAYRVSQIYLTGSQIRIGILPTTVVQTTRDLQTESPFLLRELNIGYQYSTGPIQTGLIYTVSTPFNRKTASLSQLDYQVLTTTIQLNISEIRRMNKANKAARTVERVEE
jgi:hypothetical protein